MAWILPARASQRNSLTESQKASSATEMETSLLLRSTAGKAIRVETYPLGLETTLPASADDC